jgi:hypothetical protein
VVKTDFAVAHSSEANMNYSTPSTDIHAERTTKSGTRWRHKSIICDGDFVNDLRAVSFFAPKVSGVYPVVGLTSHTHSLTETFGAKKSTKKFRAPNLPPVSLPCSHPDSFKPKRKPWRDSGEEVRGLFFHAALENRPNVKGFTLMLSRPVERLARAKGKGCLRWLHKRVERALRRLGARYTGGVVPFWFAIEESRKGRLHIHGEISIGPVYGEKRTIRALRRVVEPIRKALKSAGGRWDWERDGEGIQLRFARGTPDFRWCGYAIKSVHKARPERRRYVRKLGLSDRRWVAGFEGKAVTASSGLSRKAIVEYDAAVVAMTWL